MKFREITGAGYQSGSAGTNIETATFKKIDTPLEAAEKQDFQGVF
ncbi:hypothetical protein EAL2_c19840 [Peptoclostridium acidaminophilum DSM 3953]|uniref:Uncharacterized protein n=1 Tax=Peptoclostridium acidaminophilum DSM 3953 TaxID=1286171 RepID=W8T8R6_PEPAC|nr:hypothetical protein EAL2_c19840 [Peptoclostridium acidaminophilum DSM 3953]